ncbi:MAG: hypothetical protein ABFD90_02385 [Phycisphaerales bacterium]
MANPMSYVDTTKGATRMIHSLQIHRMGLLVLLLSGPCLAAGPFSNEDRRQAFLRALEKEDESYDSAARMLWAEFSSPGYHTTLQGGVVHRTRESLKYAVALLDSGDTARLQRAAAILNRVIALQDQDPGSRTYGIWPWFLEEPLDRMSPPDWNWADFCGVQLLQVAIDHMNRLPPELQQKVKDSILHAARSIQRRDVGPAYTNIALMGTYVTLVAGERFSLRDLSDYGRQRLRRFYEYTREKGSFTEYNSPTYTCVAIEEISRMIEHVRDHESQTVLTELNQFAWQHVARRFHPSTRQWAGPHSRSYSTLLPEGTLAFIERATSNKVAFMPPTTAWESLDAQRLSVQCPNDLETYFTTLDIPRIETEAFVVSDGQEHDLVGTTYLHPEFTLGSVNISDLWNQRRPLVAYWRTPAGAVAARVRFLHNDYDYACASLFTVQDAADALGAVLFATDRGDTHISLDKIANAAIRAKDLRLRLEFEGAVAGVKLPEKLELDEPLRFTSGLIEGVFTVHSVDFDGLPSRFESQRQSERAWIDLVLYHGAERSFNFNEIREAAIVFTLSITPSATAFGTTEPSVYSSVAKELTVANIDSPRRTWHFQRTNSQMLSLTIPIRPLPTAQQKAACSAKAGEIDPWKFSM